MFNKYREIATMNNKLKNQFHRLGDLFIGVSILVSRQAVGLFLVVRRGR
jgi:hypothetical protein